MKILLTTDWWAPAVNGVVRSVELLRRELLSQGHEVRVLTLSNSSRSYQERDIIFLGSLGAGKVYPGARVRFSALGHWLDQLAAWGPDVIHSQCEFSTFGPASRLARRCGCPLVHTYHTVYEDYTHYFSPSARLGKAAVERFTRLVAGKCDAILAPTDKVRALLDSYGVGCPVVTVPTGIDLTDFHPAQDGGESRRELRRELDLPEDGTVLVSVGRLAAEKNHGELLRLLAQQAPEVRPWLLFVGDGPVRAQLEEQTHALGLDDKVRFVGMVPPRDVARWYQVGDAFVCASQSETQGLTYFEALACGLPALCRADPCLDGVIENGVNGWQWRTGEEFAAALDALCAGGALRRELAQHAVETAARYSAAHFARQVLEVYEQVRRRTGTMGSGKASHGLHPATVASSMGLFLCVWLGIWAWKAGLLTDMQALQAWIGDLGWWAPAAFVLFQAVQVVVPILPGGLGCLAGVVLFGPWFGFAYNYVGICAGSLAAFAVARHCGRPLLQRMFSDKLMSRYQKWTGQESGFARWFALAIFLPVAPDDFLCYLAGTTSMRWRQFTLIILACKPFAIAAYSTGLTVAMNALLAL